MTRVFLIANGEMDLPIGQSLAPSDRIVCADGGANYLQALAFASEAERIAIVGDLDSTPKSLIDDLERRGATIQQHPRDKDASDLELAIKEALKGATTELICIAAMGGRHDHALTNIALLSKYAESKTRIVLLGRSWSAQFVTPFHAGRFLGKVGDIFSLVPISAVIENVNATGLKWPLHNARLVWGTSLTVSNEFNRAEVEIELSEGLLLAFHFKKEQN